MTMFRGVLLAIAIVLAMVVASLTAEPDDWPAVVEWAKVQEGALQRDRVPCPVLFGAVLVGEPHAGYQRAIARLQGLHLESDRLQVLVTDRAAWPLTDDDRAQLQAMAPALAELRDGARSEPVGGDLHGIEDCYNLADGVRGLLIAARQEPVANFADAMAAIACSRDVLAGPMALDQVVGAWLLGLCFDALDEAWLAALPPARLADLAAALAKADLPRVPLSAPILLVANTVRELASGREIEPYEIGMSTSLLAFRHGFSVRRAGIARACSVVAAVRAWQAATPIGERWPARRQRLEQLEAWDAARSAELMQPWLDGLASREEDVRCAFAKLRLLRLATAAALGHELPVLDDPLGHGALRCEEDAGGMWLRSGVGTLVSRRCEGRRGGR